MLQARNRFISVRDQLVAKDKAHAKSVEAAVLKCKIEMAHRIVKSGLIVPEWDINAWQKAHKDLTGEEVLLEGVGEQLLVGKK